MLFNILCDMHMLSTNLPAPTEYNYSATACFGLYLAFAFGQINRERQMRRGAHRRHHLNSLTHRASASPTTAPPAVTPPTSTVRAQVPVQTDRNGCKAALMISCRCFARSLFLYSRNNGEKASFFGAVFKLSKCLLQDAQLPLFRVPISKINKCFLTFRKQQL